MAESGFRGIKMEMCGRCYDEASELFEPNCEEKPELLKG